MNLQTKPGVPLYVRDVFNPEKQDDGAARRLFVDGLFRFLVDTNGNLIDETFEGFFVLTFIFGELFDAYMKRDMTHIERVVCVFRTRHFLNIWRVNIIRSETRYPDLFQKQSSFLADATFQICICLCDQFTLLSLAHLEHYPNVPFMPWHHGTHYLEHFFGITRSFIAEFSFGQLVQMYKHISFRQRILSSGKFDTKKEKDSNNGYSFDFVDSGLNQEEIVALKQVPSRSDLDRACEIAWKEAAALASQFCAMEIPDLPLKNTDLHPHFRATAVPPTDEECEESDDEDADNSTSTFVDLETDVVRILPRLRSEETVPDVEGDIPLPGVNLTPSEALAHAAHHIVTETYFSDEAEKDEAELEAIDKQLDVNPDTPVSGRMLIANLLNPAPLTKPTPLPLISTFLTSDGTPILRSALVEQRIRHCAGTHVHSEAIRKPETNIEYMGGKFSLNHAAHQLKEGLQQSEGLRNDTTFQKARYRRWIAAGPVVEWTEGCRLDVALRDLRVPNLRSRGVNGITPIRLGSLVVMRTARRMYLGEVLGIYRFGSLSGKHDSFTDAETVEGLSYLSLRAYEQFAPGRNIFQHISLSEDHAGHPLPLFTHVPIREFVYLLTAAVLQTLNAADDMYSISGGDVGWERWQVLTAREAHRILGVGGNGEVAVSKLDEVEEEYEEPDEGTSTKKQRLKAPRGAIKKPKTEVQQKPTPAPKRGARKGDTESVAENKPSGSKAKKVVR
ncbi:hypothetical protein B0H10DRAFT_2209579 [Mycena sp. CBHHK59/15]|nr:hypothetical protein B0H10DRAFT_2209579 [Mycena sp. CBHHK59/15]